MSSAADLAIVGARGAWLFDLARYWLYSPVVSFDEYKG